MTYAIIIYPKTYSRRMVWTFINLWLNSIDLFRIDCSVIYYQCVTFTVFVDDHSFSSIFDCYVPMYSHLTWTQWINETLHTVFFLVYTGTLCIMSANHCMYLLWRRSDVGYIWTDGIEISLLTCNPCFCGLFRCVHSLNVC